MTDEYIRREDMLDAVEKLNIIPSIDGTGKPTPSEDFRVQFLGTVLKVESADVAPVVHAKWEHVKHKSIEHGEVVIDGDTVRCSACRHAKKGWDAGMNFCPNCGAKMDREE